MYKTQRNERIALMMKILSDAPGKVFTLGEFAEMFLSAKSTISEDIDVLESALKIIDAGKIVTLAGAAGGVMFIPSQGEAKRKDTLESLCAQLSRKERMLPGGYLYMLDVIYDPRWVFEIAKIFAGRFFGDNIDYVITVETKGIPLAYKTAELINVPLIIARHNNEATDGSSVNINYVSGSSKKIQTMALSIKALKRNSRLLFIDDFMKGGGTAKGITELLKEFSCEVSGIGVLISTVEPQKKLVDNFYSLLSLYNVDEEAGVIDIKPAIF